MYNYEEIGKYAKAFQAVETAINDMISEYVNGVLSGFEIKSDDNGNPQFDQDRFERIILNIAAIESKSELLLNLFFNGYKSLITKDEENERVNEEGKETV